MSEEETVTFNLELNVSGTYSEIRKLQLILYRTLGLLRRLGLPEEASQLIHKIQHIIMIIRLLQSALTQLTLGPLGWALGAVGIASATLSFSDMLSGY